MFSVMLISGKPASLMLRLKSGVNLRLLFKFATMLWEPSREQDIFQLPVTPVRGVASEKLKKHVLSHNKVLCLRSILEIVHQVFE